MTDKKQAVFVRIPNSKQYSPEALQEMAKTIQSALQYSFDKEVVVLMITEDIHFMSQADITDLIDTLGNLTK